MKSYLNYFVLLSCLNFIVLISGESPAFRCDYKYSAAARGWFKYFDAPVTWFYARLRCGLEGAALASPTTTKIKAEIISFLNNSEREDTVYEIFTGIHSTIASGDFRTIEGLPLSAIPHTWTPNEPDNKDNNEKCLILNSIGDLADVPCDLTRPYVCYRAESTDEVHINECGTIDPEYHLDTRTNKCYKFHKIPNFFSGAYLTCSAEGGHLAVINSDTEATVLAEIFAKYPEKSLVGFVSWVAFLGFTDWAYHVEWRTIHGQTLAEAGYDKFAPGNPDNNGGQYCGAMFRNGKLDDMRCNQLAAFICEKSPDYIAACSAPIP